MHDLQFQIADWQIRTFSGGGPGSKLAHLEKEIDELKESLDPEEVADCAILLFGIAADIGCDLIEECWKKLDKNRKRIWGDPDENGVIEHV